MKNPSLYEINTRVWLRSFDTAEKRAQLKDVPSEYWDKLAEKGIDYIWLMGIWNTSKEAIKLYNFEEGLVSAYRKALKDWKEEDVIGSPYSILNYEVNPDLGDINQLLQIKTELNKRGIGLILDFIPNHFSALTPLIKSNPELFLTADPDHLQNDPYTFFKNEETGRIFAHGRDPFFPAWQDTVQVNYFNIQATEFMIKILVNLTKICDGVRCDMAMLALNNVFKNTWAGILERLGFHKPKQEFWKVAIEIAKNVNRDFIFIGEAYWDLGWELQQLGFDFTYDKRLLERLTERDASEITAHLHADLNYQEKLVRFIENHDEERAITALGKEKSMAAAVVISTLLGMRFYHDGQFEGKSIRLPVQLGREPNEKPRQCMINFYDKLLKITNEDIFKEGEWYILDVYPGWSDDNTYNNIMAWLWKFRNEKRLVVVNYSDKTAFCRVKLDVRGYPESFQICDLLNDKVYQRYAEEVFHHGLFVELQKYKSHIFSY
jgi:glycosidase